MVEHYKFCLRDIVKIMEENILVFDGIACWKGNKAKISGKGGFVGRFILSDSTLTFISSEKSCWKVSAYAISKSLDMSALKNKGSLVIALSEIIKVEKRGDFLTSRYISIFLSDKYENATYTFQDVAKDRPNESIFDQTFLFETYDYISKHINDTSGHQNN